MPACPVVRYVGRLRGPQTAEVQPPFLRPALTEAQLEAKVLDNGLQNDRHSNRVTIPLIQFILTYPIQKEKQVNKHYV